MARVKRQSEDDFDKLKVQSFAVEPQPESKGRNVDQLSEKLGNVALDHLGLKKNTDKVNAKQALVLAITQQLRAHKEAVLGHAKSELQHAPEKWINNQEAFFAHAIERIAQKDVESDAWWQEEKGSGEFERYMEESYERLHPVVRKVIFRLGLGEALDNWSREPYWDWVLMTGSMISDLIKAHESAGAIARHKTELEEFVDPIPLFTSLQWAMEAIVAQTYHDDSGTAKAILTLAMEAYNKDLEGDTDFLNTVELDWIVFRLRKETPLILPAVKYFADRRRQKYIEEKIEKTYTYENKPKPHDGGMEEDKGNIDAPLSALAKSISTDINVQAEFERQARMLISKVKFIENESNPPPIPERKYHPHKDDIAEFLQEVWGEWNDRDLLSRRILQIHDRRAHRALVNYLSNGGKLPDGMTVLTQKDETDRWLENGIFTAEEAGRAANAIQTRKHK